MRKITLREAQELELEALTYFDSFCAAHGMQYSMVGGTLLGAVREGGFIPWDDDVDVFMSRPDYEKLASITFKDAAYATGKDSRFEFIGPGHGTYYPWIRLVDNTTHTELQYLSDSFGTTHLFIDIFPVDGIPVEEKARKKLEKRIRIWRRIELVYFSKWGTGKTRFRQVVKAVVGPLIRRVFNPLAIAQKLDRIAQTYPYESSEYVSAVVISDFHQEPVKRSDFDKVVPLTFEGQQFSAMSCWEEWLTGRFGDYMTPRPDPNRHYVGILVDE